MALSWCVVLAVVCLITWAFIRMEQDPILSNMGKTEPREDNAQPGVTLLATQFPAIGDAVFSVFNPTMKSLSH